MLRKARGGRLPIEWLTPFAACNFVRPRSRCESCNRRCATPSEAVATNRVLWDRLFDSGKGA